MQAPAAVQRRDRPVGLVGSQAAALIPSLDHLRDDACAILRAAIEAADPSPLVTAALAAQSPAFPCASKNVHLIAAGKAAWPMAQALCAALRITTGVAAGRRGQGSLPAQVEWIEGPHPLPDDRSLRAAVRALDLAAGVRASGDALVVLLSGGGSSMLAAPAPG
ncbi:MAG TPA: DUF4147 domain-containing protein, partial [Vicinamibacterales bacterium]|nr:DUF4147 domain-containing protein [Vicinamibacterales bacterium]